MQRGTVPSLNVGSITGIVVGGTDVTLFARVVGNLGIPITPATIASIAWQVSDLTAGVVLGSGSLVVGMVVFPNLIQTDPRWIWDSAARPGPDGAWGYNFLYVLAASLFPLPTLQPGSQFVQPDQLQADIVMTPNNPAVNGNPFHLPPFLWQPQPSYLAAGS
jgi:hypothetical protein